MPSTRIIHFSNINYAFKFHFNKSLYPYAPNFFTKNILILKKQITFKGLIVLDE